MTQPMIAQDLGLIDYEEAYTLQKKCVAEVLAGQEERLLICEHPPVITLGRSSTQGHILSPDRIEQNNIRIIRIDRGGDVTLHTPGQLVAYPILDLGARGRDLAVYIRQLEQVAIDFLKGFGIVANRFSGHTGVWVGDQKICSIGIGVRKWVTFHGLAVNIAPDLNLFSFIKPCGLEVRMTSVKELIRGPIDFSQAKKDFLRVFMAYFSDSFSRRSMLI